MNRKRNIIGFVILPITVFILLILDILLGSVKIPLSSFLALIVEPETVSDTTKTILFDFRLPKAFTALIVGVSLSVSGLQMQTFFRNPLAGPYVLGLSSGASLGVAIAVLSGFSLSTATMLGQIPLAAAAWIGTALVLGIILAISQRIKDIMTILVFGMMLGSAVSAIIAILQYFSNEAALKSFVIWSMGNLGGVSNNELWILLIGSLIGLIPSFLSIKNLNAMLLGEEFAHSVGLNLKSLRLLVFLSTGVLVGTVTAFCGPIGFIGVAVPHIARMLFRSADHLVLIPGVALLGAAIMLLADLLSQMPGYAIVLPINAITSLIGIPIILLIVVQNQKITNL